MSQQGPAGRLLAWVLLGHAAGARRGKSHLPIGSVKLGVVVAQERRSQDPHRAVFRCLVHAHESGHARFRFLHKTHIGRYGELLQQRRPHGHLLNPHHISLRRQLEHLVPEHKRQGRQRVQVGAIVVDRPHRPQHGVQVASGQGDQGGSGVDDRRAAPLTDEWDRTSRPVRPEDPHLGHRHPPVQVPHHRYRREIALRCIVSPGEPPR
mmetsp:Transcript_21359/g.51809  ORF Transcript_21359/g.51809 Transcript_21359/m.51809 type:complete len:208 (-) Transcript_21359:654-1277(-)